MSATGDSIPSQKSVFWAYVFWLFGGILGTHHFYLRRDRHAFVWWSTLGGFGVGWLGEVFRIPRYVRDANEEPVYMAWLVTKMKQNKKPPFSMNRFTGMLMVGYSWAQMMMLAVPPDEVWGINFRYLNYLIPFVAALGVWTVGNIGREQGSLKWPVLAAYLAYPVRYYIFDESIWFTVMVLASGLAFDWLSKDWRRTPRKKQGVVKRLAVLGVCACLYLSLWCGYLYFHGTITDSEGDEVPVYEAIHHFFTSPWWLDVKQAMYETYLYAQHHGWYEVWKQIIDLSDPHGEQNAYRENFYRGFQFPDDVRESGSDVPPNNSRDYIPPNKSQDRKKYKATVFEVLGVTPEATQQEITSTWRRLSREHHPDKVKDEAQRRAAQERFMEIQQAYEILSNSKHKRNRRNKKDNSEPIKANGD